jgi:hypothetical protein
MLIHYSTFETDFPLQLFYPGRPIAASSAINRHETAEITCGLAADRVAAGIVRAGLLHKWSVYPLPSKGASGALRLRREGVLIDSDPRLTVFPSPSVGERESTYLRRRALSPQILLSARCTWALANGVEVLVVSHILAPKC